MAQLKSTVVQGSLSVTDTIYMNGKNIIDLIYPVGSIYISVNSANPGTIFPGTTWIAFAEGETIIGVDSSDSDFKPVGKEGGNKTATLVTANLPSHNHTIPSMSGSTTSGGEHNHTGYYRTERVGSGDHTAGYLIGANGSPTNGPTQDNITSSTGTHTHNVTIPADYSTGNTGSATSFSLMNPYVTAYIWKRTA